MNAPPLVTQKRALQMDPQRKRSRIVITITLSRVLNFFNRIGQSLQCAVCHIQRRRHRSRKLASYTMRRVELIQAAQFGRLSLHQIDALAAMHVNIDVAGYQDGVGERRARLTIVALAGTSHSAREETAEIRPSSTKIRGSCISSRGVNRR